MIWLRRRRERRPLLPRPAQLRRGPPARLPFARGPSARFRAAGRNRGPSSSKSRAAAARCSSPSRIRPWRASAASSISCARWSKGASSSHFSRSPNASSGALRARCSRRATWIPRKRRRWAVSQPLKAGLRSISSPSRKSPLKSVVSACWRSEVSVVDSRFGRAGDLEGVDEAIREVEADGVVAGFDAAAAPLRQRAPGSCSGTSAARRADRSARPTAARKAGSSTPGVGARAR